MRDFLYRVALITCVSLIFAPAYRVAGQEAVGTQPDDVTLEPTPIPQTPAEGPKEKKAKANKEESGLSERERLIRDIQKTMTPEDFEASGLNKLSVAELRNLQGWLRGYRQTTEAKATKKATAEAAAGTAPETVPRLGRDEVSKIYSRVDGDFRGVTGGTVIKLEDGTVWRQANSDDRLYAKITDHPPVSLSHSLFGYKMMVIGTGEFYVKPVK